MYLSVPFDQCLLTTQSLMLLMLMLMPMPLLPLSLASVIATRFDDGASSRVVKTFFFFSVSVHTCAVCIFGYCEHICR